MMKHHISSISAARLHVVKRPKLAWVFALFFLVVLTGCQLSEQEKVHKMALAYTSAWNSQVPENVAAFYSDEAMLIINGDTMQGKLPVVNFAKSFMRNFPNMQLTMDSLVKKGDRYRYYWSFKGNYDGPYGNGNEVIFNGFEQWELDPDHRILLSSGTYDEEDFRRQLNTEAK